MHPPVSEAAAEGCSGSHTPIISLSSLIMLHHSLKPVSLRLDQTIGWQFFGELAFAAWSGLPTEELPGD